MCRQASIAHHSCNVPKVAGRESVNAVYYDGIVKPCQCSFYYTLRNNEEERARQSSQELSDLATQVLDFCTDTQLEDQTQLSDLSELLAHYDTIKHQQQILNQRALQLKRAQFRNGMQNDPVASESAGPVQPLLNGHPPAHKGKADVITQSLLERTKRKPLIRPALPVLSVSKEKPPNWGHDLYKTEWTNTEDDKARGKRTFDRNTMADSGIEVSTNSRNTSSSGGRERLAGNGNSSSDGYNSSGSEDLSVNSSPPVEVICNPAAR